MPALSPIRIKIWSDYACFTRPEMKVKRVSYDVITPSVARGVLEAIYWKPQVRWVIERLHVLKPIQFTNIRSDEVSFRASAAKAPEAMSGKLNEPLSLFVEETRQQPAATILRDVAYVIEARFELLDENDSVEKHYNIVKRRAEKGQCFHRPYLGCREFRCDFEWVDGPIPESELQGTRDLGDLLHGIASPPMMEKSSDTVCSHASQRRNAVPHFFRAVMRNGIIDVPPLIPRGED